MIDEHGDRQFDLLERPTRSSATRIRRCRPTASGSCSRRAATARSTRRACGSRRSRVEAAPSTADDRRRRSTVIRRGRATAAAIVFASTRDGGDFDLYRLTIADGRARRPAEQLTSGAGHEVTPTRRRRRHDHLRAITPHASGAASRAIIEKRAPDGAIAPRHGGPGRYLAGGVARRCERVVFARPKRARRHARCRAVAMPRDGGHADAARRAAAHRRERARCGRPMAASCSRHRVLRGAAGNAVFSSVIVDRSARRPRARAHAAGSQRARSRG